MNQVARTRLDSTLPTGLGIAPLNRGGFRDADSDNFAKVAPEDNEVMVGGVGIRMNPFTSCAPI